MPHQPAADLVLGDVAVKLKQLGDFGCGVGLLDHVAGVRKFGRLISIFVWSVAVFVATGCTASFVFSVLLPAFATGKRWRSSPLVAAINNLVTRPLALAPDLVVLHLGRS